MSDDHMAVWEAESTAPTAWELWVKAVETLVGHHLDGNWFTDGYSLDTTYEMWEMGLTPADAAASIAIEKRDRPLKPFPGL